MPIMAPAWRMHQFVKLAGGQAGPHPEQAVSLPVIIHCGPNMLVHQGGGLAGAAVQDETGEPRQTVMEGLSPIARLVVDFYFLLDFHRMLTVPLCTTSCSCSFGLS